MSSLKNKKALVTGGSRGLGEAIALALADEGVNVAITGRNKDSLEKVVKKIKAKGVNADYSIFDVKDKARLKSELESLQNRFGSFDILINNAGIAYFGEVLEMQEDTWEDIVNTNLFGPYYVTKSVLPNMIDKNTGGDIINVSSTAGLKGTPKTSAYSASKAALSIFSESLMYEMRKNNIRVTTLFPSTISTELTKNVLKITDGNPDKVLQPEDFAEIVIGILKLKSRVLIVNSSIFSTNP